jgi:hypothetical protein
MLPATIYRRRMTNLYYTKDGRLFCNALDDRLQHYYYSASIADKYSEVEIWRLRRAS